MKLLERFELVFNVPNREEPCRARRGEYRIERVSHRQRSAHRADTYGRGEQWAACKDLRQVAFQSRKLPIELLTEVAQCAKQLVGRGHREAARAVPLDDFDKAPVLEGGENVVDPCSQEPDGPGDSTRRPGPMA